MTRNVRAQRGGSGPTTLLRAARTAGLVAGGVLGVACGAAALGAGAALVAGATLARKAVSVEAVEQQPVEITALEIVGDDVVAWITGSGSRGVGKQSFLFEQGAGHARLGPVRDRRGELVARTVVAVDRGELVPGVRGRLTGWWFVDPAELGYRTEQISYPTELGAADAWIVRPRRSRKHRWAVLTHGRGAAPAETLRGLTSLLRAGVTCMVISYRNDVGAPAGEAGRYGLGVAESRDVDAAIEESLRRGARRVTLVGWSMGGTASLVAATRGAYRDVIDGLILDSPAIDWANLLVHHAALSHAPAAIAEIGVQMLDHGSVQSGERGGIDFSQLTPEAFGEHLSVPVLIHAGTNDTYVPPAGAEALAEERPDLVQLHIYPRGGHVRLWNADPEKWERLTEQFARALPSPGWRG